MTTERLSEPLDTAEMERTQMIFKKSDREFQQWVTKDLFLLRAQRIATSAPSVMPTVANQKRGAK